jgi:hypothetical protein
MQSYLVALVVGLLVNERLLLEVEIVVFFFNT